MQGHPDRSLKNSLVFLIILLGILFYWAYLGFVTQPILVHDAKGYEDLGRMIYQKGWEAYFVSGPNREPIYPFLVSWCMQITQLGSYQTALKFFQVVLLFGAVGMTVFVLNEGKISSGVRAFALLYLGISPAFVNSALSVYSEIVTYIPILGIVLLSSRVWDYLQRESANFSFGYGIGLGLCFVAITLAKGIYEIIFPLYLLSFIGLAIMAFRDQKKQVFKNTVVFLFSAVLVFGSCICGYKSINKKYNGFFTLTDRGAWALYGNTARRQEPLTLRKFWAGGAYNLFEEDDCARLLDRQSCHFWDIRTSDDLAAQKNYEVSAKFPLQERDREFAKLIRDKIFQNPFQYILLTGFDWVHMFFWESTRIGFVAYPDWLDVVFDNAVFAKALRFIVGFLSIISTVFCCFYLFRHRKGLWQADHKEGNFLATLFFLIYLIMCHVTLYSLFATVPRFALPIAPLFILVIAFTVQILSRNRRPRSIKTRMGWSSGGIPLKWNPEM